MSPADNLWKQFGSKPGNVRHSGEVSGTFREGGGGQLTKKTKQTNINKTNTVSQCAKNLSQFERLWFVSLIWFFTSLSTIFQLCRDGSSGARINVSCSGTQWRRWGSNLGHYHWAIALSSKIWVHVLIMHRPDEPVHPCRTVSDRIH